MTVKELNRLLTANNIQEDARLMSDSGWECGATDMDGVFYNPKDNIVVFDQSYEYSKYNDKPEWIKVEVKTGHWIDDKCSICGKGIEDLIDSPELYEIARPNFCPFCGIKMEVE